MTYSWGRCAFNPAAGGRTTASSTVNSSARCSIVIQHTRQFTTHSSELQKIRAITERWSPAQRWTLLLARVLRRYLGGKWLEGLSPDAKPPLNV